MQEIAGLLTSGDAAHVNALLSKLSDSDLRTFVSNMDLGGAGGVQGLNAKEQQALFTALASKASPEQYGRLGAAQVTNLLSGQGLAAKDSNAHMHSIAALLTTGDTAHNDAVLSRLSNHDLENFTGWASGGGVLGMQGFSDAEFNSFYDTLAQKVSPAQYGRVAAAQVRVFSGDQGTFGLERNAHMHLIAGLLTRGGSDQVNAVLSNLSDADLEALPGNIEHGQTGGREGLSLAERGALYQQLASKGDAAQLARFMVAMKASNPQPGSAAMSDLTMLTVAIGKYASPQTQDALLTRLSQTPEFSALARMNQFTGSDGKPIWEVSGHNSGLTPEQNARLTPEQRVRLSQERRFALASQLIQDPSLTPQKLANSQDMAYLSLGAYSQNSPDGKAPSLPQGFPPYYKVVKNYTDNSPLSGFKATLFEDTRTNTYVLAFCGTNEMGKEYSNTNVPQGFGLPTAQYGEAIGLAQSLKSQYGSQLTEITGHSLGGGLAAAAGMATGIHTVTFDAAGVNPETERMFGGNWNPGVVTNYDVRGEVLGKVQDYYPTHFLQKLPAVPIPIPVPGLPVPVVVTLHYPAPSAVGTQYSIEPFFNGSMQTEPETDPIGKAVELHSQNLIVPGMIGTAPTGFQAGWPDK
jgi:hypothetical protein